MSEERYTYAVARVRAKESTLLNKAALDQLLACKTSEDCLRALAERGWGSENTHTAEEMLKAETEKTWQFLNSVLPDAHTLDVFRLSADFHNLKAAIKQVCTEQETPNVFCEGGTIPAAQILAAVQEQRFESLPPAVKEWAGSPRGLCDMVNHNSKSELNRFVRPGFNKMLADAPICDLKAPALTQLPKSTPPAAQIGDGSKSA